MFIRSNLSNESITKIFLKNTRKIAWIFLSMQFIELGFLWTIYRSKIIPSSTFSCYHCIIPYPFLCASKCFSSIKYLLFDLITSPWLYHKRCPIYSYVDISFSLHFGFWVQLTEPEGRKLVLYYIPTFLMSGWNFHLCIAEKQFVLVQIISAI